MAGLLSLFVYVDDAALDRIGYTPRAVGRVKSGTAFFVSRDGFLVTSAHVIAGCSGITVWPANGSERIGRIVAADAKVDIALLWIEGDVPRYAAAPTNSAPRAGDPVSTIGFGVLPSRPREPVVTNGNLIGVATDSAGHRILLIHARLLEGNSGGPVIDGNNSLVGLVMGRDSERPQFGAVTPSEEIDRFLSQHDIAPVSSVQERPQSTNAAELLKEMSVLVQCATGHHHVSPRAQQPSFRHGDAVARERSSSSAWVK